ncbi:hypothetical protein LX32DRAFT_646422 [Colletotrichum zoysiae]|uniref:Uncharacterized protein n=1 Tax=Colletotrichum zoysiae TaxID=1216348 RepID=A0AAD9H425_9PEZI|nr:hypothetical protein LX32DRAFT_646422 [Colletotrichum zoysiae]
MLDLDKVPRKEDSRKRARDAEVDCADQVNIYKRPRAAHSVSDGHEHAEQSSLFAAMHPTPPPTISSQLDSCMVSRTHFSGAEALPGTDYLLLEEPFGLFPGRIQAPIFHSATIPPWFGFEQQLQQGSFENELQSSHAFLPSSGDSYQDTS